MNRRKALLGLLAAPLAPSTVLAQGDGPASVDKECKCVCMEERDGAFVLEGIGKKLSEPFTLVEGAYRIEVMFEIENNENSVIIELYDRNDPSSAVDGLMVLDPSDGLISGIIQAPVDGEYLLDARLVRGNWKIVLSPI